MSDIWNNMGASRKVTAAITLLAFVFISIASVVMFTSFGLELNQFLFLAGGGVLATLSFGLFTRFVVNLLLIRSLEETIYSLDASSEQINSASEEVSRSSQSLAESSNQQAASLQETTSSLEEISSQTQQTDTNTKLAKEAMMESNHLVENGMEAISNLSKAMHEIEATSKETTQILKTIDDIAFQTNLLALNAAVEAARAGEAGKGFAVVAEEVRSLAQRSAEAAQNTAELITKSQRSSENGVRLSDEAEEHLKKIAESAGKVDVMVKEISEAAGEQAIGLEQLTTVMNDMDRVVQSNASMSEESASAAEQLSGQAAEMKYIVRSLRALLGNGNVTVQRPELRRPAPGTAVRTAAPQKAGATTNEENRIKREEPGDITLDFEDDFFSNGFHDTNGDQF